MNKNFEILGLNEQATNEEITAKYNELVEKYSEERFLEGEAGNEAAKKLTEVKTAYKEIMEYRHENSDTNDSLFKEVDAAIRSGDYKLAQDKLDSFDNRSAEWHYLQSVVFYKKNWNNECKKQLEIAMQMDPTVQKYKTAYDKLVEKMNSNPNNWNQSSSSGGQGTKQYSSMDNQEPKQMGGGSCVDFCCQLIACNALLNCCCNGF